jgi:hypothetical protein
MHQTMELAEVWLFCSNSERLTGKCAANGLRSEKPLCSSENSTDISCKTHKAFFSIPLSWNSLGKCSKALKYWESHWIFLFSLGYRENFYYLWTDLLIFMRIWSDFFHFYGLPKQVFSIVSRQRLWTLGGLYLGPYSLCGSKICILCTSWLHTFCPEFYKLYICKARLFLLSLIENLVCSFFMNCLFLRALAVLTWVFNLFPM